MPTVLVRAAESTQMAFRRVLPITGRPSGLLKKATAGPQRCLFGVPNHHESIRVARDEIKVEQQRLTSKYNFDFENDSPLPGKFQYEKIDHSAEAVQRRLQEVLSAEKENINVTGSSAQKNLTGTYSSSMTPISDILHFLFVNTRHSLPRSTILLSPRRHRYPSAI